MKRHTFFFPPVVFSLGRAMSECLNPRSCCTVHGEPIWVPDRAARLFVRSTGHRCPDHAPTFRSRRIPLDSKIQNSRKKNLWMGSVMATHTIVKLFGEKKHDISWYLISAWVPHPAFHQHPEAPALTNTVWWSCWCSVCPGYDAPSSDRDRSGIFLGSQLVPTLPHSKFLSYQGTST